MAAPTTPGPERPPLAPRRWLPIVAAFLVTRGLVLALHAPDVHIGDQVHYLRVASSVLEHGWSGYLDPGFRIEAGDYYPYFPSDPSQPDGAYNPIFWDPLYPLFLALVLAVFGASHGAIAAAQLAVSLATLLLGMDVVRRTFPRDARAPEIFGWAMVAYLPLAGFVPKVLAETLDALLLMGLFWLATRLPRGAWRHAAAFGALLGLYVSIRSYWLQLAPLLLLGLGALLVQRAEPPLPGRAAAARVGLAALACALVLAPTYVRNHNLSGAWLISTKGPWNFWKDNNGFVIVNHDWREPILRIHRWLVPYYRLGSAERVPRDLEGVYADPARPAVRPPCDLPLPRLGACERDAAIGFFFDSPLRFARRALQKNANLWSPNDYVFNRAPPGPFAWNASWRAPLPEPLRWALQLWAVAVYLAALALFAVGVSEPAESAAHRFARALLVASLLYLVFVVTPWGHGVSRFRLPLMPPILAFATLGALRLRTTRLLPGDSARERIVAALRAGMGLALLAVCAVKLPLLLAP